MTTSSQIFHALVGALACAVCAVPVAHAQELEIRTLAHQVIDAIDRADTAKLEPLLAPTFTSVRGSGQVVGRQQFLSDVKASPVNAGGGRSREWIELQATVLPEGALYVGRTMWQEAETSSTARSIYSTLVTQRWRSTRKGWQLEFMQRVRLPPMPEVRSFRSGDLTLKAMLFRPSGPGPHPVIVYAHGNEPDPSDLFEAVAPALVARGYVVWGPHRRGSGLSADQGPNLLRTLTQIEANEGIEARSRHAIEQLRGPHLSDMAAAVAEVKTFSFADPDRVYLIGNSFGGVLAMLAAERDIGVRAAANFAGAAINWERSEAFRNLMMDVARRAQIPVFVGQAENDFSTSPTRQLAEVLQAAGKPHKAMVFPKFGITPLEGHSLGVDGVDIWAGAVLPFMEGGGK